MTRAVAQGSLHNALDGVPRDGERWPSEVMPTGEPIKENRRRGGEFQSGAGRACKAKVAPYEHAVAQRADGHDGVADNDADQRHDADDVDGPITGRRRGRFELGRWGKQSGNCHDATVGRMRPRMSEKMYSTSRDACQI